MAQRKHFRVFDVYVHCLTVLFRLSSFEANLSENFQHVLKLKSFPPPLGMQQSGTMHLEVKITYPLAFWLVSFFG